MTEKRDNFTKYINEFGWTKDDSAMLLQKSKKKLLTIDMESFKNILKIECDVWFFHFKKLSE